MKLLPQTKDEVRTVLRDLMEKRDLWHIDDDPIEIFGPEEGAWRAALVRVMEVLWEPKQSEEDCVLASAWAALEDCCPELFDAPYWNT
jgi:hypothetical protein